MSDGTKIDAPKPLKKRIKKYRQLSKSLSHKTKGNVSGMVKNRKLSRAISDLGWRQFRTLLEGKAEKYGRDLSVISRWEPTSQKCSCCGFKGGKLDLLVREWECLNCGTKHDRDTNAAINILVAGGQSETLNGRGGKHKTSVKLAAACETSIRRGATAQ